MLNVKIVGERLPGRACGDGHTNVHVGVQRGDEIVQLQPAEGGSVKFTFGIVLREQEDGTLDFRSPFVHGKPGDRFFYLVWADVDGGDGDGTPTMFSRIKLMLAALPAGLVTPKTGTLEGYLSLTTPDGKLVTAAVRPPAINWSTS
jgi:hypothetical protein